MVQPPPVESHCQWNEGMRHPSAHRGLLSEIDMVVGRVQRGQGGGYCCRSTSNTTISHRNTSSTSAATGTMLATTCECPQAVRGTACPNLPNEIDAPT